MTFDATKIAAGSRVVFDWDNTLKVINREKKYIESRVSPDVLQDLVHVKHCRLYIISAIRPSRINMETLLMEVDRLGFRELFCPAFQGQIRKGKMMLESGASKQGYTTCPHGTQIETVNDSLTYVRWGNIVICNYDKAEIFKELVKKETAEADHRMDDVDFDRGGQKSSSKQCPPMRNEDGELDQVDYSVLGSKCQVHSSEKNESDFNVCDGFTSGVEESPSVDRFKGDFDMCDGLTDREKVQPHSKKDSGSRYYECDVDIVEPDYETDSQKPVYFYDDEEVNIVNFRELVKGSICTWVH